MKFMKMCLVGAKFYMWTERDARTDGKTTDMTKQTVVFRSFANAPKNKADKGKTDQKF